MGQELKSLFQLETKRLLWFIGITFAVILAFQYIELPYGNFLISSFSPSKIPPPPTTTRSSFQAANPPSKSQIFDNLTILNLPSSNDNTRLSKKKDADPNLLIASEPGKESEKALGSDETEKTSKVDSIQKLDNESATASEHESASSYAKTPSLAIPLTYQTVSTSLPTKEMSNFTTLGPDLRNESLGPSQNDVNTVLKNSSTTSVPLLLKDNITSSMENEGLRTSRDDVTTVSNNSSITMTIVPDENKHPPIRIPKVISISEMNKLLLQSHASYRSMRPRWSSAVDQELLQARSEIDIAPIIQNDPSLYAPLYHNVSVFKRSYDIMEERLKVYVYREGARPIMHSPFLGGIYASEGWFMKLMESNKRFVTKDPKKAHLFYLPFSSRMLEETLNVKHSHNHKNLKQYLNNYVDMIAQKHPFWNRTGGSDHFLVACYDWAPEETKEKMATCIRALCNADVKEGFVFGKDVSLPETYIRNYQNPTIDMGGKPASKRSTLAFFAGRMHGHVRPKLLLHWENKDPDMKIFGRMPKSEDDRNYIQYMKSSKYCICARGYEVNSPRVVEAISYECVPVIISDNFVPPFSEVLNWESFAVFVMEKDIPNLKNILLSIPRKRYLQMQMRVRKAQQHFLWHAKPVKYDIFHMILHSIWYNRVFTATSRCDRDRDGVAFDSLHQLFR